jgi:ankyrin repeat protein
MLELARSNSEYLFQIANESQKIGAASNLRHGRDENDTGSIFSFKYTSNSGSSRGTPTSLRQPTEETRDSRRRAPGVQEPGSSSQGAGARYQNIGVRVPLPPPLAHIVGERPYRPGRINSLRGSLDAWLSTVSRSTVDEEDIFIAVAERNHDMLQTLVDVEFDLSLRNEAGHTALNEAVHISDAKACRILVKGGARLEARCYGKSCAGTLPIHIAAMMDSVEVMQVLLEGKARIDSRSHGKRSALHWAAECDSTGVIEVLLSASSNPLVVDVHGNTALHIAARSHSERFIHSFLSHPRVSPAELIESQNFEGHRALQVMLETGWLSGFRILRGHGAKIDYRDADMASPLHHVARQSIHQAINDLISAGADVNARDCKGFTPLHYAVLSKFDSRRAIRYLLDSGADIDARAYQSPSVGILSESRTALVGPTPLLLAAQRAPAYIVRCLVDAGADSTLRNSCGCGVLKLARSNENTEMLFELLRADSPQGDATDPVEISKKTLALAVATDIDFEKIQAQASLGRFGNERTPAETLPSSTCDCKKHEESLVRSLVSNEANSPLAASAHNEYLGKSALEYCVHCGYLDGVRVMLSQDGSEECKAQCKKLFKWLKTPVLLSSETVDELNSLLREAHNGLIRKNEEASAAARIEAEQAAAAAQQRVQEAEYRRQQNTVRREQCGKDALTCIGVTSVALLSGGALTGVAFALKAMIQCCCLGGNCCCCCCCCE